jgi:molybdenum cofactor guanylyltransferase
LNPGPLGILLAGGRGERLGLGRPKALAELAGETLLARACAALRAVCAEIVVVAPADLELPAPQGARRLLDPGLGPLGGIAACAATIACARAVVLGVDFPLVRPALLAALLQRLEGRRAVVPSPGGRPQPLVAAYAGEAVVALAASFERGERSVTRAVLALEPLVLEDVELAALPGGLESFGDVDTRDALADAERRLRAAAASR